MFVCSYRPLHCHPRVLKHPTSKVCCFATADCVRNWFSCDVVLNAASVALMKNDESTAVHKLSEAVHLDPTMFVAYEGKMIFCRSFLFLHTQCHGHICTHTHACTCTYTHTTIHTHTDTHTYTDTLSHTHAHIMCLSNNHHVCFIYGLFMFTDLIRCYLSIRSEKEALNMARMASKSLQQQHVVYVRVYLHVLAHHNHP